MTTTTSTATVVRQDVAPLTDAPRGANFAVATAQTARRTLLQYLRTPQLVVLPIVTAALFLFVFRYIFGGAIRTGSVDYVDYLLPGFLVGGVLWTAMNAPAGVAEDAASGVHDRMRSLPIPRAAVVAGRTIADAALTVAALAVATGLGFAVGFRTHAGAGSIVLAFALLAVVAYVFAWVFVALGLVAGNAQAAQGMSTLLVVPIAFASSAYVPVDSMPGWLQPVAAHQPLTALVNAMRSLVLGGPGAAGVDHTTAYWVALSFAWCAGLLAVSAAFAVRRFARLR
jgi:ABC transporter DrrB family efflux protein